MKQITFIGVPCKNCGGTVRYKANHSCRDCTLKRGKCAKTRARLKRYYQENRAALRAYGRQWYKDNKAKQRARRYGITEQEVDKLYRQQNGRCAICRNKPIRALGVDHCHSSGTIRGLLCENCNRGLGLFKDNVRSLQKAITYLEAATHA